LLAPWLLTFSTLHQNQKIGGLLKHRNINKRKGISSVAVFRVLLILLFAGKNLFRTMASDRCGGVAKVSCDPQ
jgi:hypothetical protein